MIIITPSLVFCNSDEVRALLEFKKGIHEDPLGKVIPTWNATAVATASDLDSCPTSFHGVVCDDASNSVVAISLNGLNLSERIHDLWNLQHLNLSNNRFSGGYPTGIRNLQQLRVLDVHANELWGDIGVFFSELRNVEFVDLSMNKFSGGLPVDSSNVSSLGNTIRHMNLSSNLLGGKFLTADTLSLFQSLVVLDLGDNMIGGELPSFGSLYNLRVLRLRNNQLYGEVPGELLATLIQLKELDLSGNGFSGSIRGINSTTLEILDLSSNRLTGSFPEFSSQSGLTTLRISNNSLEGSLPSEWRQFAKLSKIDLSINNLAGRIPPALFSLNLRDLNLSKNHFNGAIPFPESTTVGLLGRLRSLNLAKNSLSGHIPNSLVNIDGLESLDLSSNQFKGHLPGKLPPNLKLLNVTYNDLSGTVPESLRSFPPSSFHPGNEKLYIPGDEGSPGGGSNYVSGKNGHRGSKSSIKIAIILASVGAALMIAFVALAYYRSQLHGSSKYNGATTGRDVKVRRFTRPSLFKFNAGPEPSDTSLSFSNTHLLTSNSRTLSGQAELVPDFVDRAAAASSTSYVKPNLPDNL
uniref:Leucine-rich repeat-containing N-terminal plant-type domain-containing protein n=1 Tax=Chenopodium quinoa TaxID=63459 RepID=A0A803NCD3_CHEQI